MLLLERGLIPGVAGSIGHHGECGKCYSRQTGQSLAVPDEEFAIRPISVAQS
jgi:hypothetical protein